MAQFPSASGRSKRSNDLHNKNEIYLFKWGRKKIKGQRKKRSKLLNFQRPHDSAYKSAAKDQCRDDDDDDDIASPLFLKVGSDGEKCSYS